MRLPLLHSQQSIWNRIKDTKLESKELRVVYRFYPRRLYHLVNMWIKVTGYLYVTNVFCGTNFFKSSVSFTESRHTFYLSLSIATNPHNFVMAPMLDAESNE